MNDFETIARFTDSLQAKWNKTAAKEDNKKSFKGMQKLIKQMRFMLQNEKKDREAEYQRILENGKFTPAYIGKQRVELDKQYQKMKDTVISGLRKDIKQMIADKYKKLDAMLTEAPTSEQVALLNALQMRGKNVSRGELMVILPTFMRNYQSMKIFESLANAAGYNISTPFSGTDIVDLYAQLDKGGQYLLECVEQVGNQSIHLHRAFFHEDPKNPGNADIDFQPYIDMFDVPAQLQDVSVTDGLSEAEKSLINSYFAMIDGFDPTKDSITILRSVQQIMHSHPEDIDKMLKSKYAQLVAEVQELEAINKQKADADEQKQKEAASDK